jgi:hypothetical protein
MGFESEQGVIPTGFESERLAGIDHDAKHGDRYERNSCHAGSITGLLDGTVAIEFSVAMKRGRLHFPHRPPLWLCRADASRWSWCAP